MIVRPQFCISSIQKLIKINNFKFHVNLFMFQVQQRKGAELFLLKVIQIKDWKIKNKKKKNWISANTRATAIVFRTVMRNKTEIYDFSIFFLFTYGRRNFMTNFKILGLYKINFKFS